MRLIFSAVLIVLVLVESINCNKAPNAEELEASEDWKEVNSAICKKEQSSQIQAAIEKCNELDPYYKLDSFSKKCDKLRPSPGSSFYEEERGECKYQECYDKAMLTDEFKKASEEVDKMPEEDKVKKSYEKYKCIRKVLGLKV